MKITPDVSILMQQAYEALRNHNDNLAFTMLNNVKILKQPLQNLDYLRANYFLRNNQLVLAREALGEELKVFHDNIQAGNLSIFIQPPQASNFIAEDKEFKELCNSVSPYTMLNEERLFSLFSLAKRICLENITGNFIQCGIPDYGSTILLASVIKRYSKQLRRYYVFNSFNDTVSTNIQEMFGVSGHLDMVKIINGRFQDNLCKMQYMVGMISFLHIDTDEYEYIEMVLNNLYKHIANEGFIQINNYFYSEEIRKAIHNFELLNNSKFTVNLIDGTAVWLQKADKFPINTSIPLQLISDFQYEDPACIGIESQMSPNERFQLYYAIRNLLPGRTSRFYFVEVGSYAGASLVLIWRAFKRLKSHIHGFTVEPGGTPQFYEVIKQLGNEITHFRMYSYQAVKQLKQIFEQENSYPELIFIDGDHTYEGVKQDIINYYPLLAPGGIMVFHDYLPPLNDENREAIFAHHAGQEPGIRRACQELMEDTYHCDIIDIPLLYPADPTQTQPHLPIIPGVFSTIRAYKKHDLTDLSSAEANIKQNKKHKRRKHK